MSELYHEKKDLVACADNEDLACARFIKYNMYGIYRLFKKSLPGWQHFFPCYTIPFLEEAFCTWRQIGSQKGCLPFKRRKTNNVSSPIRKFLLNQDLARFREIQELELYQSTDSTVGLILSECRLGKWS